MLSKFQDKIEKKAPKVLIIEDRQADSDLLIEYLNFPQAKWQIQVAQTLKQGLAILATEIQDIVLLDLSLPDSFGLDTLEKFQAQYPDIPVIVVTGSQYPEWGLMAVNMGAQDFLVKGDFETENLDSRLYYSIRRQKLINQYQSGSQHDTLTSLPNRQYFMSALQKAFNGNRPGKGLFGVIFLDLDYFKALNDQYGHTIGDQFLLEIAQRLNESIRSQDMAARLGGDEFAILIQDLHDHLDILPVLSRILKNVARPFMLHKLEMKPSASLGVALSQLDFPTPEAMLDAADTAMYHAKAHVKGSYIICTPELLNQKNYTTRIEEQLKTLNFEKDLQVNYQPIISLTTGQLEGMLLIPHWCGPLGIQISNQEFFQRAEASHILPQINGKILPAALRQFAKWRQKKQEFKHLKIFVQLSLDEWLRDDFLAELNSWLVVEKFQASYFYLGLKESDLNRPRVDIQQLEQQIFQRNQLGFQIYLENYGGSHVPLHHLTHLPLAINKINLEYLDLSVEHSKKDQIFLKTLVEISQTLGIPTLISGVKDSEVFIYLKEMGCTYAIGDYFFAPMAAQEVDLLI